MGYPYGKTYLQQIIDRGEHKKVLDVYHALTSKYIKEHDMNDAIDLSITEMFTLLGEAFEYGAYTLDGITDEYHFLSDVLWELLEKHIYREEKEEEKTDD